MEDSSEARKLKRRTHRKSRNGCQSCKRRKVKCNEVRPSCSYCTKHQINCQYLNLSRDPPTSQPTPESNFSATPQSTINALSPPNYIPSHFENWGWSIRDFELLHFYTVSTCFTISNLPQNQRVWQEVIPRMAFNHPILLHGLLSVSALHFARSAPERYKEMRDTAANHNILAIQAFRSVIAEVTLQDSHVAFGCAVFIFIYAWASSDSSCGVFLNNGSNSESPIEWATLLRGTFRTTDGMFYEAMLTGPLGRLFFLWDEDAVPVLDRGDEETAKLDALTKLYTPVPDNLSTEEAEALEETVRVLQEIYVVMSKIGDRVDTASGCLSWPFRAPDLYLDMVSRKVPEALVVLAHFSLLLNMCGNYWWLEGMSRKLLQEVHGALPKDWRRWIQWPLQELVTNEFSNPS